MRAQRRHAGYVLVVVLVLLAVAALGAAATVRQSLRQTLAAREYLRNVQLRWGILSVEQSLLPAAEELLAAQEAQRRRPTAARSVRVVLGEIEFDLRLADEQAKVNVDRMSDGLDRADAERRLRELLMGTDSAGSVRLRVADEDAGLARIGSYGQLIERVGGRDLAGRTDGGGREDLFNRVTCWGDGRVNVYRALPSVMRFAVAGALDFGRIQQLLSMREQIPRLGLSKMLDQLGLTDVQRRQAEALLTERSGCYSLLTQARWPGGTRVRLTIAPGAGRGGAHTFEW